MLHIFYKTAMIVNIFVIKFKSIDILTEQNTSNNSSNHIISYQQIDILDNHITLLTNKH